MCHYALKQTETPMFFGFPYMFYVMIMSVSQRDLNHLWRNRSKKVSPILLFLMTCMHSCIAKEEFLFFLYIKNILKITLTWCCKGSFHCYFSNTNTGCFRRYLAIFFLHLEQMLQLPDFVKSNTNTRKTKIRYKDKKAEGWLLMRYCISQSKSNKKVDVRAILNV